MNIEPTPAEYDSLGAAVLSRVRRRALLRRGMQFAVVGLSAAAFAVLITVNIDNVGFEHAEHPVATSGEGNSVGYSVTCYASANLDSDSVTLERASAIAAAHLPDQAILECEGVWRAGLLGSAGTFQTAAGPQSASQPSRVEGMHSAALHPCVISIGTVVVLPVVEMSSLENEQLCQLLETESQAPDTPK